MSSDYNNNTIIFTLARMNPPTPGHLFVIQQLIQEAISKNVEEVYIILSKTNSDDENPIPCFEKTSILGNANNVTKTMIHSLKQHMIYSESDHDIKSKISRVRVITICVPEVKGSTPFTPLIQIVQNMNHIHDLNLFLIIGDDRKSMLDSITGFFYKMDNIHSISGKILPREEMSDFKSKSKDPVQLDRLNISEVPVNAMSASFVRNIVKNGRKDKFFELYLPYLDETKINNLYESILHGLQTLPHNTKADSPETPLKYVYPMVKGESVFPTRKRKMGGKKRTRNNKKREKKRKTNKKRNIFTK